MTLIDTQRSSDLLRAKGIDLLNEKILITKFDNSKQASDLTLPPNCNGFGRIHHFKRSTSLGVQNPLPIDPACNALGIGEQDIIQVQVFQNAVCSWRCWYCFVDYQLLSGNPKHSSFLSASELIDLYLGEDKQCPIIDLSGGQPDLVPEWLLWMIRELKRRELDKKVYLWSDDNLSNDYLWKYLSKSDLLEISKYTLYGRVGCFKGFDSESFSFNTGASSDYFGYQFDSMKRLIQTGLDVYGYVTLTAQNGASLPSKMSEFLDRLQAIHINMPLRIVPLPIIEFSPTRARMSAIHRSAIDIQIDAIQVWYSELQKRFPSEVLAKKIYQHSLGF